MKITLETLSDFLFDLAPWDRIFLKGKLWAGKTTFAQALIRRFFDDQNMSVTSPTYTYYQSYPKNLYHFDLYRVEHQDDIVRIGAEEIFDDPTTICIIEWPELLSGRVIPTKIIEFHEVDEERDIFISDCQVGQIDKQD